MMIGTTAYECPRCTIVKPKTPEFFYFRSSGRVQGWCRACFRAWWPVYWAAASPYQKERHLAQVRASRRRRRDLRSALRRRSKYDQEIAS